MTAQAFDQLPDEPVVPPRSGRRARPTARRPEARSFRFEGNDLAYEVFGQGDHLLVYLHGLLLDADVNRGIAEALARQGNRVVLLDLLGHGRSDHPEHASAYRIDLYARQVFALLDHLGADQAVLGGVSLGANVSLQAAVLAPERVRGLVVEMPALEWAVPAAAVLFVPLVLALHYARPVATVLSGLVRHLPRTPFAPMNSMLNAASLPPEQMAAVLHGILVGPTAPAVEERRRIAVPTLVLGHRNDLIHPLNDATNLVRELPNAHLVRARSPLELRLWPDRLTGEMAEFLAEVWSIGGPSGRPAGASGGARR
ncbi:MAG: alpha/beta hydrolase [Actinobacteria bacterium]|nr:MAG: alpha/beta hydrolase [Actinomycetota bacterium]